MRGDNLTYVVPAVSGTHSRHYVVLSPLICLGWIYAARPMTYGVLSSNILLVLSNVIRAMAMIARLEPERT